MAGASGAGASCWSSGSTRIAWGRRPGLIRLKRVSNCKGRMSFFALWDSDFDYRPILGLWTSILISKLGCHTLHRHHRFIISWTLHRGDAPSRKHSVAWARHCSVFPSHGHFFFHRIKIAFEYARTSIKSSKLIYEEIILIRSLS
jgi:hypothetical protein